MTDEPPALPRLVTGVTGLDRVLGGGLFKHSVYIVEGPPGAGKTIFGNQMCHHHAEQGAQVVYMTLLAESHARMIGHLRGLGFFRPELVGSAVHYVSGFKVMENEGLAGLLRVIRETVAPRRAVLLVLDGLVSAVQAAPSDEDYKKFVHELQTLAALTGCTALLLVSTEPNCPIRPEDTLVDGIIELSDEVAMLRPLRHLSIRKLRGAAPVRGKHTLEIDQRGISVLPRIEAQLLRLPEQARLAPGTERVGFGLSELDEMLHGGLPASSTTMLLGPTGAGKTILGLQFLAAGVERRERGLFFGFYERPYTLLEKSQRIGIDLRDAERDGLVHFAWEPFGEASIDVVADRLLRLIREHEPKRLMIDGMQGFQQAVDFPERLRAVLSSIVDELEAQQITTLYTTESREFLDPLQAAPLQGISAVTHNIIVLRHLEQERALRKLIGVVKLRDSGFEPRMRELLITDTGLSVEGEPGAPRSMPPPLLRKTPTRPPPSWRPPLPPPPAPRPAAADDKPYIVIVEDEFGLAELLAEVLAEQGYATAIAINGELGLGLVRERRPDLVLVDLMMPVLNGSEMLRRMRADPALAEIPVALMTALPETARAQSVDGSLAVLQKPFTPEQLFEVVRTALHSRPRT